MFSEHVIEEQDINVCIQNPKKDTELILAMKMLASSDVADVLCNGNTLIQVCSGKCCDKIMIMTFRSNNAVLCPECM